MPRAQVPRKHRYTQVALPTSLVDAVREAVNQPDSFYTSLADLVKEPLREKLERLTLQREQMHRETN